MRLNIGCGKQTWDGFYCIDAVPHKKAPRAPDLLFAFAFEGTKLKERLPLDDGCADEVHSYHFLEHVTRWQAPAVLSEFKRLLRADGLLVLELPNLEAACRNLLAGMNDQMSMWPIYGDWNHQDEFMLHRHGYTPATVRRLLEESGFANVKIMAPQTHGARVNRDMRVEAIRA